MSENYTMYTLEGAFAVLIIAIAHKIYKMRCSSSSDCCGDAVHIQTSNPGDNNDDNV